MYRITRLQNIKSTVQHPREPYLRTGFGHGPSLACHPPSSTYSGWNPADSADGHEGCHYQLANFPRAGFAW